MNLRLLMTMLLGLCLGLTVLADDHTIEVSDEQMLALFRELKTRPMNQADEVMFNNFHDRMHKILYAQLESEASKYDVSVDQYVTSEYTLATFIKELKSKADFFTDPQVPEAAKFAYHYRCVIRLKYFHDERRMTKTKNYRNLRESALSMLQLQARSLGFELNL